MPHRMALSCHAVAHAHDHKKHMKQVQVLTVFLLIAIATVLAYAQTTQPVKTSPRGGEMTHAQFTRELEHFLNQLSAEDRFSGTILIAKDSTPLFRKAYGLASKGYNIPNRIDTKFNLGSMNKMFTGVAMVQLAEQGKLSLDDTVGKHLPDYPNKEDDNLWLVLNG